MSNGELATLRWSSNPSVATPSSFEVGLGGVASTLRALKPASERVVLNTNEVSWHAKPEPDDEEARGIPVSALPQTRYHNRWDEGFGLKALDRTFSSGVCASMTDSLCSGRRQRYPQGARRRFGGLAVKRCDPESKLRNRRLVTTCYDEGSEEC